MNGDPEITRYAVKVICKMVEIASVKDGDEYWVCYADDDYGPSGRKCEKMPYDVMTFKTRDEARQFAGSWEGHPWWVKPKDWRIVEVKPKWVKSGWEPK